MKRLNGRNFELIWLDWAASVRCACADEYAHGHTTARTHTHISAVTSSAASPHRALFVCSSQEIINSHFIYLCVLRVHLLFTQVNIIHGNQVGDPFFLGFHSWFRSVLKILEFGKRRECDVCMLSPPLFVLPSTVVVVFMRFSFHPLCSSIKLRKFIY